MSATKPRFLSSAERTHSSMAWTSSRSGRALKPRSRASLTAKLAKLLKYATNSAGIFSLSL